MTEQRETPDARRKRLSEPMGFKGAEFACDVLGLDHEYAEWFASQPRGRALVHFEQVNQLPESERERDVVARMGKDGSPT